MNNNIILSLYCLKTQIFRKSIKMFKYLVHFVVEDFQKFSTPPLSLKAPPYPPPLLHPWVLTFNIMNDQEPIDLY
jgi:hypothetical protein